MGTYRKTEQLVVGNVRPCQRCVVVIAKVLLQEVEERFGSSVQILLRRNFSLIVATSKIQFLRTVRCANHETVLLEVLWLQGIPPSS